MSIDTLKLIVKSIVLTILLLIAVGLLSVDLAFLGANAL